MNNIIKLPLFVFCLLLSFNSISSIEIEIHKGFKGANSNDVYVSRDQVRTAVGMEHYDCFLAFLEELGFSDNPPRPPRRSERLRSERFRLATASAVSLQASGSSGLSLSLMPGGLVNPFEPADASRFVVEEVNDGHVPFADLFDLAGKEDRLDPQACRRLRKDFVDFYEIASDKLKRASNLYGQKGLAKIITDLYHFFLENLEYADLEDTVITGG